MDLKKEIIESMRGIIIDNEARTDDEIVEFYADVFGLIAEDYAKEKVRESEKELGEKALHWCFKYSMSAGQKHAVMKFVDSLNISK